MGYLDDVTMGGDASTVAADFTELEAAAVFRIALNPRDSRYEGTKN